MRFCCIHMEELLDQLLEFPDEIVYPTKADIIDIHDDIVEEDEDAEEGILGIDSSKNDIDFILERIEHGHFTAKPETIHEKAVELMRLLASNHIFVDGNKRTALNTTAAFYWINGYHFEYGDDIKAILKLFAVKEEMVDTDELVDYMQDLAQPISNKDSFEDAVALLIFPDVLSSIMRVVEEMREKVQIPDEIHERYKLTEDVYIIDQEKEIKHTPETIDDPDAFLYMMIKMVDDFIDEDISADLIEEMDIETATQLHDERLEELAHNLSDSISHFTDEAVSDFIEEIEDRDEMEYEEARELIHEFMNEFSEDVE